MVFSSSYENSFFLFSSLIIGNYFRSEKLVFLDGRGGFLGVELDEMRGQV